MAFVVELAQQLSDRRVEFGQTVEAAVAQAAEQPSLDNQHCHFDFRLVARPARPCWQDRSIVVGRHLGVGSIDLRLVEAGFDDGDLGVVRHQQPGHAANGGKGSRVGRDPIAEPLRPARFGVLIGIRSRTYCPGPPTGEYWAGYQFNTPCFLNPSRDCL